MCSCFQDYYKFALRFSYEDAFFGTSNHQKPMPAISSPSSTIPQPLISYKLLDKIWMRLESQQTLRVRHTCSHQETISGDTNVIAIL